MQANGFRNLLQRAQTGDRPAMDRLLAAIRPDLERRARGYVAPNQPDTSASDLVQSVCLRAWQKLDHFHSGADDDQTLAQFHAWMGRILHRLGLNATRFRATQRRKPPQKLLRLALLKSAESSNQEGGLDPAASGRTPSSQARVGEEASRVRYALERISDPTDRAIVQLRFFETLSLRRIADRLQLSDDKVRERYHVLLRRLERELGGLV